jgi:chorismate mutase/prephenate dehydratase
LADQPDLSRLRETIEAIDRELIALLAKRLAVVVPIAEAKLEAASPFRDSLREGIVFSRVRELAREHGLDPHRAEALYRVLLEWSVARQQEHVRQRATAPLRIAYQGVEGCYTHLAARQRYGGRSGGALLAGHATFRDVAEAVRQRAADVGLMPIENTTAGSITATYDLLAEGGLSITAEVVSHIQHCLLATDDATVEGLREVHSHPQALGQCERFFVDHPWIRPVEAFDTAGSARMVAERGDPSIGAIASEEASTRYGLQVLARHIQTQTGNYTRFVEVATEPVVFDCDGACKTTVMLELSHEPGALARVLAAFAKHRVDLSKLESRPIVGKPWSYRFYADLAGHRASKEVSAALDLAQKDCADLKVLGCYPAADVG